MNNQEAVNLLRFPPLWCHSPRFHESSDHVKGEHLKAAEDGSVEVFIVANVIFQRRNPRPAHAAARGDPDASPTPDEVRSAAKAAFEPTPKPRAPPPNACP